jgi:hypothetical protein
MYVELILKKGKTFLVLEGSHHVAVNKNKRCEDIKKRSLEKLRQID